MDLGGPSVYVYAFVQIQTRKSVPAILPPTYLYSLALLAIKFPPE